MLYTFLHTRRHGLKGGDQHTDRRWPIYFLGMRIDDKKLQCEPITAELHPVVNIVNW